MVNIIKTENIFSNRLFLKFEDSDLEKEYKIISCTTFPSVRSTNILISLLLVIFAAVNAVTTNLYSDASSLNQLFKITSLTGLGLNIITLTLSILILPNCNYFSNSRIEIGNYMIGFNFFMLWTYFLLPCSLYNDSANISKAQTEIYTLICTVSVVVKIFYIYFFANSFVIILISCLISYIFHGILIGILFNFSTFAIFINPLIALICYMIIAYGNEVNRKMNWYKFNNKTNLINFKKPKSDLTGSSHLTLCDNLKHSMFIVNNLGDINYLNKSMGNLIKSCIHADFAQEETLEKRKIKKEENFKKNIEINKKDFENFENIDNFVLFKNNKNIINEEARDEIIESSPRYKTSSNLLPQKESKNELRFSPTLSIQNIFNNMTYINEELSITDKNIYNYLYNIKISNMKKGLFHKSFEKQIFNFKEFAELIKPSLIGNMTISNKGGIINTHSTRNIINLKIDNTGEEFQQKILRFKTSSLRNANTFLLVNNNDANILNENTKFIEPERRLSQSLNILNSKRNSSPNKRSTTIMTANRDNIFIGKVCLRNLRKNSNPNQFSISKKDEKEYFISCIILPESKEVCFIFEDYSDLLNRERREVANVCRSLYLSKISHELKNPICNLLEITSLLNDEINNAKIQNTMNFADNENQLLSPLSSSNDSIIDDSSCEDNNSNKSKTKNKSTSLFKIMSTNLKLLKSTGDMMMLIFRDFTFYSNLFDDSNENNCLNTTDFSPDQTPSNNPYNIHLSPDMKDNKKKSIKKRFSKLNTINRLCNFKDIMKEVTNIFISKAEIDNKANKLSISLNFEEYLPDVIECDREIFKSLFFNLLYHLYKTTLSGKIEIAVSYLNNVTLQVNSMRRMMFDIKVIGVINVKNQPNKEMIFETDENDADSSEEDSSMVSFFNNNLKSDSDNKEIQQTLNLFTKSLKKTNSEFAENFHLKNILITGNSSKRNSYIDNFNQNFHYYISNIYASRLGIKLKFENNKKGKSTISFTLDVKPQNIFRQSKQNLTLNNANVNNTNSTKIKYEFENKTKTDYTISIFNPQKKSEETDTLTENKEHSNPRLTKNKTLSKSDSDFKKLFLYGSNKSIIHNIKDSNSSNDSPSDKTVMNNNEMIFNYSYFMNQCKNVRDICGENVFINTFGGSDKEVLINHGNIVINHLYPTIKVSSQSNDKHNKKEKESIFRDNQKKSKTVKKQNSVQLFTHFFHNMNSSKNLEIVKEIKNGKNESLSFQNINEEKVKSLVSESEVSNTVTKKLIIQNKSLTTSDKHFRILLCDDENLIRRTLHRFFNLISKDDPKYSFDVQHSENGFECLNKVYNNFKNGKKFDVLIIDETMPFIKGSQVIFLLKSMIKENNFKNINIVSFTSYDTPDKREFIFSQGADYVIGKPMRYEDFKNFFYDQLIIDKTDNLSGGHFI